MPCQTVTVSPGSASDEVQVIECWPRVREWDPSLDEISFWARVENNTSSDRSVGVVWRLNGIDVASASDVVGAGSELSVFTSVGYNYIRDTVGLGKHTMSAEVVQVDAASVEDTDVRTQETGCGSLTLLGSGDSPCDVIECDPGFECVDGDCVPSDDGGSNEVPNVLIDSVSTTDGVMDVGASGSDPDGQIVSWEWELVRDGEFLVDTATGNPTQVTLGESGNYDLTVYATDDDGGVGTDTWTFAYDAPTNPCDGVSCPPGEECQDGNCVVVNPCEGVTCGECEICVDGSCEPVADPCCGVSCGPGEECCGPNRDCEAGTCVSLCANVSCGPCETCENGECVPVDNPCCGVSCPDGQVCENGECVSTDPPDPCADVTCATCETCEGGDCVPVDNPCCGISCPPGEVCENGQCVSDDDERDVTGLALILLILLGVAWAASN